jgi:hypothetical protein
LLVAWAAAFVASSARAPPSRAAVSGAIPDDAREALRDASLYGGDRGSLIFSLIGGVAKISFLGEPDRIGWEIGAVVLIPFDRLVLASGRPPPLSRSLLAPVDLESLLEVSMRTHALADPLASSSPCSFDRSPSIARAASALTFVGACALSLVAAPTFAAGARASPVPVAAPSTRASIARGAGKPAPSASTSSSITVAAFVPPAAPTSEIDDGDDPAPTPKRGDTARAELTSNVLRRIVDAAWSHAHLEGDDVLDDLATRARDSALLPELRLRVHSATGVGTTLETATDLAPRTFVLDSSQTLYEARLTWRLDRLVFAEEEVSLERLRLERIELRQKIAARVVDLFVSWLRARARAHDAHSPQERDAATLLELEARATLDAFTDGAAGKLLAAVTRLESDP